MKEALVSQGPKVQIIDSPIPEPGPDQVLIKVVVSGCNPKDWKLPLWTGRVMNQGDDVAGIVHAVGENVFEFKPGDRVAAFHEILAPHGTYAEYTVAWQQTTFHIPKNTTFEEAATIPLAAMTSALGLYIRLGLPQPWTPATAEIPLVIYGAASAVGSYAIQLAQQSNIHPLICIAGRAIAHVEALIDRSKGDVILDYRIGDAALVEALKTAAAGRPLLHALDAVSGNGSYANLGSVLAPGAKVALVLPNQDYSVIPDYVQHSMTGVSSVHKEARDFGHVYYRYLARGLQQGWFRPQPHVLVPGGLGGIQGALEDLRDGKASAVKYVLRLADTEGVGEPGGLESGSAV